MILAIILVIIWIYFVATNLYWLLKTQRLYKRFLSGKEITSYIPEIDEVFRAAGTSRKTLYDENKGGYKQRTLEDISYAVDKSKYHHEVDKVFLITKGVFRQRLKRSIIPIHLLFLPSYIITSKQLAVSPTLQFVLNLIYWLIGAVAVYLLNTLLDYLFLERLTSLLDKLL